MALSAESRRGDWAARAPRTISTFSLCPKTPSESFARSRKRDFATEKTDPSWLYKAWKEDVLVDVIFKSKGDIYLDSGNVPAPDNRRVSWAASSGWSLRKIFFIIKAAAHSELTPGHWHDAIALLTHAQMDWQYLASPREAGSAPDLESY